MKHAAFRRPYITYISIVGALVIVWAVFTAGEVNGFRYIIELMLLSCVAQIVTMSTQRSGVVFGVSQAINLAAVALFGIQQAILIAAVSSLIVFGIMTYWNRPKLESALVGHAFNSSMETLSLLFAGLTFTILHRLLPDNIFIFKPLDWLIAAVVYDQVHQWMLAGLVFLQRGTKPIEFFRKNGWTMPLNVAIGALGGSLLVASILGLGFRGILLFLVPLVLSAYAFHMYVRATDKQLDTIVRRTRQLEAANEKLSELAHHKDRMMAILSHDMRTSLAAIHSSVEILQEQDEALPDDRQRQIVQIIANSEQTLANMVENILTTEDSAEAPPVEPRASIFNFSQLVTGTAATLQSAAEERHIRLRCYAGNVPVYLEADEQMIQQVLMNVISNAVKYTPENGSVFVSLQRNDDNVILDIEDTGYGIPDKDMTRIFDPYYRVDSHRSKAVGSGLGLSVVKRNVEAHGGSIDIESQVGLGTRFCITLPMHNAAEIHDMVLAPSIYTTQEFLVQAQQTATA